MRRFIYLVLILGVIAPSGLPAAPVPERKNAKPAVINAGTEKNIAWVLEKVASSAPYAIRQDFEERVSRVAGLVIIRNHKKDWNNQKDWDDFRDWMKKNLRVERVRDTKQVRVSFLDGKPEEQAAIINIVVDHFLKEEVEGRRAYMKRDIEKHRPVVADLAAKGGLTKEQAAKAEAKFKKDEEYIRTLPALVEHAKAR